MLINTILPHITHVSHQIHTTCAHGDTVRSGGEIIRILDTSQFEDEGESGNIVFLTLDDSLGEILALVPKPFFDELDIQLKDIVVVEGMLYQLKKETDFVSKANSTIIKSRNDEPLRILVKEIKKIQNG